MISKKVLRGVIHCHSRYSYDSVIPVASYLRLATTHSLDFIILTDHETLDGSLRLREAAARYMPSLQVPIAAEYCTDHGDIIAAFLTEDIPVPEYELFVCRARAQNALLLLPHPYDGHHVPERLAAECDVIEVFNSRSTDEQNRLAVQLASEYRKPVYAASDAHLSRSLPRVILEVENLGDLRNSLLAGKIGWLGVSKTPKWEAVASQMIKAWKRRDAKIPMRLAAHGLYQLAKRCSRLRATTRRA
jgi:predicted metal-dependent phosphoesterase TrpH